MKEVRPIEALAPWRRESPAGLCNRLHRQQDCAMSEPTARKRPGRKARVRQPIVDEICKLLSLGMTRRAACGMAGLDDATLWRWCEDADWVVRSVQKAEAEAEVRATATLVRAATGGDWRAAVAWLQARRRQDWSPTASVDVNMGSTGGVIIHLPERNQLPSAFNDSDAADAPGTQ